TGVRGKGKEGTKGEMDREHGPKPGHQAGEPSPACSPRWQRGEHERRGAEAIPEHVSKLGPGMQGEHSPKGRIVEVRVDASALRDRFLEGKYLQAGERCTQGKAGEQQPNP